MIKKAKVSWKNDFVFCGETSSGARITFGHTADGTIAGPSPMEMVLLAAGGCTAIDVVHILKKMRVDFDHLEVEVVGERADTHPRVYRTIKLVYTITGKNVPKDKVEKAVKLSQEKYCSVAAMVKGTAEVSYELVVKEA